MGEGELVREGEGLAARAPGLRVLVGVGVCVGVCVPVLVGVGAGVSEAEAPGGRGVGEALGVGEAEAPGGGNVGEGVGEGVGVPEGESERVRDGDRVGVGEALAAMLEGVTVLVCEAPPSVRVRDGDTVGDAVTPPPPGVRVLVGEQVLVGDPVGDGVPPPPAVRVLVGDPVGDNVTPPPPGVRVRVRVGDADGVGVRLVAPILVGEGEDVLEGSAPRVGVLEADDNPWAAPISASSRHTRKAILGVQWGATREGRAWLKQISSRSFDSAKSVAYCCEVAAALCSSAASCKLLARRRRVLEVRTFRAVTDMIMRQGTADTRSKGRADASKLR